VSGHAIKGGTLNCVASLLFAYIHTSFAAKKYILNKAFHVFEVNSEVEIGLPGFWSYFIIS
jgi:hypothetical protein